MRRVVVTGLGLLSPFGMGFEHSWKELLTGRSAAKRITEFEVEDLACKIAHVVPRGDGSQRHLQSRSLFSSRRNCARSATSSSTGSRPPTRR